jgi:excisionase family DNA binding protein
LSIPVRQDWRKIQKQAVNYITIQSKRKGEAMFLTIKQAAALLNVSTKTIQRRIKDGSIPAHVLSARMIRIDPKDLQAYMDGRKA